MLTPVYTAPETLEMPDIYAAVYDYVLAYALPAMPPENIYRGWQNRSALPPDTNEYAVISVISNVRHGTGINTFEPQGVPDDQPERYKIATHYEVAIQIDCCSDSDFARQRAAMLSNFARSDIAAAFFRKYGLGVIDASDPSDITMTDESNQFVQRSMITLRLLYWVTGAIGTAWFNDFNLVGVKDVDAFFKP